MNKDIKQYENVRELVTESAKKYKDNIAYQIKHKNGKEVEYEYITFERVLNDINNFGAMLYSLGYKGKRVAVIGKNRYEWTVAHLANLFGNIVSVPLDKDLQVDELESSLIRSKADAIVFDPAQIDKIEEIKKRNTTQLKEYISMDVLDGYTNVREIVKQGENLSKIQKDEYLNCKIDSDGMGVLLFTSGTTSKSKAVMLCQRGMAANIYALQNTEDIRSTDVNIAFLPYHHIFGFAAMVMMLSCGVKTVFPDGLKYIKQNLCEYQVSVFVGVPALVEAMYKAVVKEIEKQNKTKLVNTIKVVSNGLRKVHIDIRRIVFKSILDALGGKLRMVIVGGAPADPEMAKGFSDFGVVTYQGYGLTETSPVIAAESPKYHRAGSVGKPMFNDIIEIVDKDEDGIGQIRVKGPNIMLGYYEMKEKTDEVLKGEWFYTGDLGYLDKDGYLFLTGRSKDMIVLKNGKKVFPEELELLINRLDEVEECMVFGMPDKNNENDVKLSVKVCYNKDVFKNKQAFEIYQTIWEKIKEINTTFPKYKHIKNLIISEDELIKTTTKKIKRPEEMKLILGERSGK